MNAQALTITMMNDLGFYAGTETSTGEFRFKVIDDHLFSELKDEAVVLSLKNGKYYGLNAVGVSIWQVLQNAASFEEIKTAIMKEYEVDQETCEKEVMTFLQEMVKEDLVEIVNEKAN